MAKAKVVAAKAKTTGKKEAPAAKPDTTPEVPPVVEDENWDEDMDAVERDAVDVATTGAMASINGPDAEDGLVFEDDLVKHAAPTETKMAKKKRLKAERKALLVEERELDAEFAAGKEERKEARVTMASCRKEVKRLKAKLRAKAATTYAVSVEGDVKKLSALADDIDNISSDLSYELRAFASCIETVNG